MIEKLTMDGITVSSTFLKTLVEAGDTEAAIRFFGHPHTLSGVVQPGRHLGHTLGFPTANLLPEPEILLPARGVYAVRGTVDGQSRIGVCNIGTRPTVGGHRQTVETWLSDFDGDLYGKELTVDLEALKEEIFRNRREATAYFERYFHDNT